MTNVGVPPGWYRDPSGQGDGRYWNGVSWTEMVDRGGTTVNVAIDPTLAQMPPAPGTQYAKPVPYAAAQTVNVSTSRSPGWGVIIGGIVVALIGIVILIAVNSGSSDDTPTPGTDVPSITATLAPRATDAPAAPSTDGG